MTFASTTITTVEAITPALTVAAGGDVLGDRRVGVYIDKEGGKAVLARVKPLMDASDVAFVNLECPVSDEGIRNPHKEYTFRGRPDLINGLKTAGIDVVSLANNHTLDYGVKALLDTISRLDEAGVQYAGAGADAAVASSPALLSTRAGMVAVLAFTEIIPGGFAATNEQPGVSATTSDRGKLLQAVSAAAEKADFVIVSLHWGIEYENYATDDQRKLAHQIVDAGGDLILGHHPHVIQGMELYRDKLIAYSLGDFVFDHYSRDTGEAFVLQMVLPPQGPPAVKVTPIYLAEQNGVPGPVTGDEADAILTRLMRLSSGLGLELARSGDHAILGPLLPSR